MIDLTIDLEKISQGLIGFLQQKFSRAGFKQAVIGLSGGIDSSTSCALVVQALAAANVYPVLLPYGALGSQDVLDALDLINWLKIPLNQVLRLDIKTAVDELVKNLKDPSLNEVRRGNLIARVRMTILFDQAKRRNALVVGTENKSEHLLGYYTRFGDEASDIEPLRGLYKTQIAVLAKHLQVPERILNKVPSAGLWAGQTDEAELGFSYQEADQILYQVFDQGKNKEEVVGLDRALVEKVIARMEQNSFKHRLPLVPD